MSNEENSEPTSPLTEHQWKKGQSGNPKGRPKGTSIARAIRALLEDGVKGDDLQKALARVAISRALNGDVRFYQMVLERTDGKVVDKVETDSTVEIVVRYADNVNSTNNTSETT